MQSAPGNQIHLEAKRARLEAAGRKRRVVFNDDSLEFVHTDAATPEGFLASRLKPLAGTSVDTICWSVIGPGLDGPSYDTKLQPIFGDAHDMAPWMKADPMATNLIKMIRSGICPLQLVVDFAHQNGIEAFASMRMNDVHDSFVERGQTIWKMEHPELKVDSRGVLTDLELYITSQDFTHEDVRQRKLELIEEICSRYDVDGFELDYIRHPAFFSRTLRGLPVSDEEVAIMTSFMARIRQIADEAAARRGRPILIAARLPDTFELCRNIGLDLDVWLKEDLIDIFIAGGGYAPFSLEVEEFVKAGHAHGVPVYPCINQGTATRMSQGAFLEVTRALAANWYRAGVDGIYTWNQASNLGDFEWQPSDDPEVVEMREKYYACLADIGDPGDLVGKNKLFCVDGPVTEHYKHISNEPPLPVTKRGTISEGVLPSIPLWVGDDVEAAAASGVLGPMKLTVEVKKFLPEQALSLRLNGQELTGAEFVAIEGEESQYEIHYEVTSPPLKMGRNFVEAAVKLGNASLETRTEIHGVRLKVEYK